MSKKIREEAEKMTSCVAITSLARQAEITLILLDALDRLHGTIIDTHIRESIEDAIAKAEEV